MAGFKEESLYMWYPPTSWLSFGFIEAASRAIVQFLEINQSEEASRGWMLLTTINLLASSGQVSSFFLWLITWLFFHPLGVFISESNWIYHRIQIRFCDNHCILLMLLTLDFMLLTTSLWEGFCFINFTPEEIPNLNSVFHLCHIITHVEDDSMRTACRAQWWTSVTVGQ